MSLFKKKALKVTMVNDEPKDGQGVTYVPSFPRSINYAGIAAVAGEVGTKIIMGIGVYVTADTARKVITHVVTKKI